MVYNFASTKVWQINESDSLNHHRNSHLIFYNRICVQRFIYFYLWIKPFYSNRMAKTKFNFKFVRRCKWCVNQMKFLKRQWIRVHKRFSFISKRKIQNDDHKKYKQIRFYFRTLAQYQITFPFRMHPSYWIMTLLWHSI